MINNLRKILRFFHPEGIPQPGTKLYNFISQSDIFQQHYNFIASDITNYCHKGKLLDIGTGPGWLLLSINKLLPNIELFGVDISASMIDQAKLNVEKSGNKDIQLRIASATQLPFPDGFFDCIVSTGSIHHWKDIQKGLTEIYRVLKKDCFAVIYDLVQKLPENIRKQNTIKFGKYKMILLWLHSFKEPFYTVEEMKSLPSTTPFHKGEIHFTGALCCLVLRK